MLLWHQVAFKTAAWNLPEFTITLFCLNQFTAKSDSIYNKFFLNTKISCCETFWKGSEPKQNFVVHKAESSETYTLQTLVILQLYFLSFK